MSNFLMTVAVLVLIAVFILGIVAGNTYGIGEYSFNRQFNFLVAFGVWIGGSIPAFILLGIADISGKLSKLGGKFRNDSSLGEESENDDEPENEEENEDTTEE